MLWRCVDRPKLSSTCRAGCMQELSHSARLTQTHSRPILLHHHHILNQTWRHTAKPARTSPSRRHSRQTTRQTRRLPSTCPSHLRGPTKSSTSPSSVASTPICYPSSMSLRMPPCIPSTLKRSHGRRWALRARSSSASSPPHPLALSDTAPLSSTAAA